MSFANEVRRWVSPRSVGGQMALVLVVSTLAVGASGFVREQVLLSPAAVLTEFKLWQLVSPVFVVPVSPMSIIFGVLILLQGGAFLEAQWGALKVWRFVIGVGVLANVCTVIVGAFSGLIGSLHFDGGYTTLTAVWVAQGLLVGPGRLSFWGFPVSGYAFAAIGAAFVLVNTLIGAWVLQVPELFGLAITFLWVQGYTPARLLLIIRSRALDRELRRRSSHLSVVQGQKKDRDQYLN